MSNRTHPLVRRSMVLAAAVAVAAGSVCTYVARAQDKMGMDDKPKVMALTPDEQKMVMDHMAKAKMMAADPAQAEKMTMAMAKTMVMDHMAMAIAMDPAVMKQHMADMQDPALNKVHEDATKMAMDPSSMEKMKAEVMADPEAMKMVMKQAASMMMMHGKMGGVDGGKMMDKMHGEADKMHGEMDKK